MMAVNYIHEKIVIPCSTIDFSLMYSYEWSYDLQYCYGYHAESCILLS